MNRETKQARSDRYFKYFLIFAALYFLAHIGIAAADTVIINQPDGGQRVCIIQGSVVTCY